LNWAQRPPVDFGLKGHSRNWAQRPHLDFFLKGVLLRNGASLSPKPEPRAEDQEASLFNSVSADVQERLEGFARNGQAGEQTVLCTNSARECLWWTVHSWSSDLQALPINNSLLLGLRVTDSNLIWERDYQCNELDCKKCEMRGRWGRG